MPRQMVQPRIREVSGVDHPAHLAEGWLLMKDATPATALLLARAEAIAKGIDPSTVTIPTQGRDMPNPISDEARAALPEDVRKYVDGLESAVAKALAAPATTSTASEADVEQAAFEKAVADLPEPIRKRMLNQQRETAEARDMAKALFNEREDIRFTEMAKSLIHLPTVEPTAFAKSLRATSEATDEATFEAVFMVLKAADAAIKESGLFKEIGSGHEGGADAESSLEGFAKALQEKDTNLTWGDAIVKAAEQHPDLYAEHRREQLRRNAVGAGE